MAHLQVQYPEGAPEANLLKMKKILEQPSISEIQNAPETIQES